MSDQSIRVSVIEPISPAIERVKVMLFRPFDLGRWFVIGFCAWLAYLGKQGGGPSFNWIENKHGYSYRSGFLEAKHFVIENLFWLAPVIMSVIILMIAIGIVLTWLSSRGQFMFLHCVAENKAEIGIPWKKFRRPANSLFLFRILLFFVGLAVIGLPVLVAIVTVLPMIFAGGLAGLVLWIVMISVVVFVAAVALALVSKLTTDFVVPIMFLRMCSCVAAWREFLGVLSANKGRFFLYVLFQIVLSIIVGMIIFAGMCLICCCCCCACCVLALPYIGTVVFLPIFVFERSYSLYYLRQYGPQYDVFGVPAEGRTPSETGG